MPTKMQIRTRRRRGRKISRRSRRLSRKVSRRQSLSRRRSKPHIRVGGGHSTSKTTRDTRANPGNFPLATPGNRDLFESGIQKDEIQKDDPKKQHAFLIRKRNILDERLYELRRRLEDSRGTTGWDLSDDKAMRNAITKLELDIAGIKRNIADIEAKYPPGYLDEPQRYEDSAEFRQGLNNLALSEM